MRSTGESNRQLFYYLLLSPVLILLVLIVLLPVMDTVRLSFVDASFVTPGLDAPFVGVDNYAEALGKELFRRSLLTTLNWTLASIVFQFALGFGLALLINRQFVGKKAVRSLFLVPWMLPGAVAALMWRWMYHGSIGLINYVLIRAGFLDQSFPWLADPRTVLWAAVLVNVWRGSPFFMIMLLGGLQTIPPELHEAAQIDGAGPVRRLWRITIPILMPLITTLLIYGFIGAFNFIDIVLVMTRGGPANHTLTLPIYSWRSAFTDLRISYAATISVLMCIFLVAFVGTSLAVRRRHK